MNGWKIIAVILMIVCLGDFALKCLEKMLSKSQSVPENYTNTVKTGGELEAKYLAMGRHEVSYHESDAMMSFENSKCTIRPTWHRCWNLYLW